MSLLKFPFVDMDFSYTNGSRSNIQKPLSLDSFLTGVLFSPYINNKEKFEGLNNMMEEAFRWEQPLSPSHDTLRDVYYLELAVWHEAHHVALAQVKCYMYSKTSEEITFALRKVCEEIEQGSLKLQHYMVCEQFDFSNVAILYKEVATLMTNLRINYPPVISNLFGHLFQTVYELYTNKS